MDRVDWTQRAADFLGVGWWAAVFIIVAAWMLAERWEGMSTSGKEAVAMVGAPLVGWIVGKKLGFEPHGFIVGLACALVVLWSAESRERAERLRDED